MFVSPAPCAPMSTSHASTSRATASMSAVLVGSERTTSNPARSIAPTMASAFTNRRVLPRRMIMSRGRGFAFAPPDLIGSAAAGGGRE